MKKEIIKNKISSYELMIKQCQINLKQYKNELKQLKKELNLIELWELEKAV